MASSVFTVLYPTLQRDIERWLEVGTGLNPFREEWKKIESEKRETSVDFVSQTASRFICVRQSANFFLELGLISSDMAVSIPLHRSTG
jgi:hypothetical protein